MKQKGGVDPSYFVQAMANVEVGEEITLEMKKGGCQKLRLDHPITTHTTRIVCQVSASNASTASSNSDASQTWPGALG
jgi:hypothetical protein